MCSRDSANIILTFKWPYICLKSAHIRISANKNGRLRVLVRPYSALSAYAKSACKLQRGATMQNMIYNENSNAPKRVIAKGLGEAKTALRIFVKTREHLLPRRHAYIKQTRSFEGRMLLQKITSTEIF